MSIINFLKIYAIAVPIFFLVDMLWLGVVAKGIYQKYIGHLMRPSPNWPVAIVFYLLFIIGLVIFVINPAIEKNSWTHALLYGAMFGFFTYMTFDLTNWAVLKDWPQTIVYIDIAWGIVLSTVVSLGTYFIYNLFK
jgi:uncharacterized membrane protein